jgi:hypothetical protein
MTYGAIGAAFIILLLSLGACCWRRRKRNQRLSKGGIKVNVKCASGETTENHHSHQSQRIEHEAPRPADKKVSGHPWSILKMMYQGWYKYENKC